MTEYKQLQSNIQKEIWNNLTEEKYQHRCKAASQANQKWWNNASKEEIQNRCNNMSIGCQNYWNNISKEEYIKRCNIQKEASKHPNRQIKFKRKKISNIEQNFINFLNKNKIYFKFNKIIDNRYLFHVDFYIPKLDLFIEIQKFWHHGPCPFDNTLDICMSNLKIWEENAKTSTNYSAAINTWTIGDVKKRKIAKKNKLNYIELFTEEEIEKYKIKLLEEIYGP